MINNKNKLQEQLQDWVEQGIISLEQKEKIWQREKQRTTRVHFLYPSLMLGIFVIGIGIISLIAANWASLNDEIKLFLMYGTLTLTALAIYKHDREKKPILYEGLVYFFMILILASIGLLSQIYHTGGKIEHALFFWAVITLPLVQTAVRKFIPSTWSAVFLFSTYMISCELIEKYLLALNDSQAAWYGSTGDLKLICGLMLLPLLSFLFSFFNDQLKGSMQLTKSFQGLTIQVGIVCLLLAEVAAHNNNSFNNSFLNIPLLDNIQFTFLGIAGFLSLLILVIIWRFLPYKRLKKLLLSLAMFLYLLMTTFAYRLIVPPFELFIMLITLFFLTLLGFHFTTQNDKKMFMLTTQAMILRIFVYFYSALQGLLQTGILLILGGILYLFILNLINRKIDFLQRWIKEVIE